MTEFVIVIGCKECGNKQQTFTKTLQRLTGYTKCMFCNKNINRKKGFVRVAR